MMLINDPTQEEKRNVDPPMKKDLRNSAIKGLSSWNSVGLLRTETKSQTKVMASIRVSAGSKLTVQRPC